MNVSCTACGTVFRIDPAKVPDGGVDAICAVCAAVISIAPSGAEAPPAAAPEIDSPVSETADTAAFEPPAAPATPDPVAEVELPPEPEPEPEPELVAEAPTPAPEIEPEPQAEPDPPAPPSAPATEPVRLSRPFVPGAAPTQTESPRARPSAPVFRPTPGQPVQPAKPVPEPAPPAESAPASQPQTPPAAPEPVAAPTPPAAPAAADTKSAPVNPFLQRDPKQKARRLARALVSDMIVYQPQKRQKALEGGTLKEDFDEEIKKSWEEYVEQVGQELADSTDFFKDALNEILAGGQQVF